MKLSKLTKLDKDELLKELEEVKQSIWGKMFNYGTVLFIGYGVVKNVMFGADVHLKEIRRLRVKFKRVSYPASVKRQVEILMSMLPRDGKQFF